MDALSPMRLCTGDIKSLAPGAETSFKEVTADWQPGEYRMVTLVERSRSRALGEIFTPVFRAER